MRILSITSSYPKFAGDTTAPFIESIVRELAGRGHEITLVLPSRSDLHPEPLPGVRFRPYRYAPVPSLELFGYAEALRADVALRGGVYLVSPLAAAAGMRALRDESRRTAYDVVHAHWVVPSGVIAALALRSAGTPLVLSLHGSDVFLAEKSRLIGRGAAAAFRRAAAVTACSRDLAERGLGLGAKGAPEVIPYGVDTDVFRPDPQAGAALRDALSLSPDDLVLLAVGRLVRKKGFEYLVEAAAELARKGRAVALLIAGRGDLESELLARARELGLGARARLLGNVDRAELPRYFAAADVVVVPSVKDASGNVDGLPNVLLEAMASATAIVTTNVAGIPDAIRSGREGLVVGEKDPKALAAALEELARSRQRRRELGREARRRAIDEFSWKHAGERFESVLRSVAEARRA